MLDPEDEEELKFIFERIHSCDEITHKDVWNPDWEKCPLCGAEWNEKGRMIHKPKSEITH